MLAQILAVIALVGVAAAVVSLVILHIVPTGFGPVRDAVSAYGISRYRLFYRAQTIATAVAAAALAIALPSRIETHAVRAVIFLVILAVVRAGIGWFPMDDPAGGRSSTGRVHNLLAFAAFAAASVGGFMVAIAFSSDPALAPFAAVSQGLGWEMSVASALTIVSAIAMRAIFGLLERLIYLGMFAWLVVTAVALLVA